MRIRLLIILVLIWLPLMTYAQAKDKAEADQLIYEELTAGYQTENCHPEMVILSKKLKETGEKGIFIVQGDSFQIKTLRSDFYVYKKKGNWTVLNSPRHPYETMTNLLLNRIENNHHQLDIRHHQYGIEKSHIMMPMQNLFDILARNMQLYCSVTDISNEEIRGVLVFHQPRLDYIHMLEVRIPVSQLFEENSTLKGDLYTNIPQSNVKSLFRDKQQNKLLR